MSNTEFDLSRSLKAKFDTTVGLDMAIFICFKTKYINFSVKIVSETD